ncbi:hypothetical protein PGTUg99_020081 [Puccinia graminis f. sp. tritici]|uniref:Uncharacterized protein n=1 Tax=Puccinia graminis f. sp. tritici TaxID=56615 RepID=A0A5B0R6M2_PUCGR|nr:hypothetical protein PGTUg99_020081 [Puccinia graminis f. sp. tritici]
MYLDGGKENLPAVEHVPCRLEGNPSSWSLTGPLKGRYPRIPAQIPAKVGGYLLADADAGADAGFPRTSSRISGCKAAISNGEGRGGGADKEAALSLLETSSW